MAFFKFTNEALLYSYMLVTEGHDLWRRAGETKLRKLRSIISEDSSTHKKTGLVVYNRGLYIL